MMRTAWAWEQKLHKEAAVLKEHSVMN
jgi:hypothetical protein